MNGNHDFADAKADFGSREDYNDRWLACVTQWRHVLQRLSLSDLVATHAVSQGLAAQLRTLRTNLTIHYGPAGDHELLDMIAQLQERLDEYDTEARHILQERALAPNVYRGDPSAFLKMTQKYDEDRAVSINIGELRKQRDLERAQWEAERKDWFAAEAADEDNT